MTSVVRQIDMYLCDIQRTDTLFYRNMRKGHRYLVREEAR